MAEQTTIQRDLDQLATELRKLEIEYNMFFSGRLPRPPWETRGRVEAIIKRYDRAYIESGLDRFRFNSLQSRFATFVDLWDRAMRAKEEGRPGPLIPAAAEAAKSKAGSPKPMHVTSFTDPMKEMDKLHDLYSALMDARRTSGQDVVPFHRFAALVKDQVKKLRDSGSDAVAFRVEKKADQVVFTVRGVKGGGGKKGTD